MLKKWLERISTALAPGSTSEVSVLDIERVSAVLLVEIARADHVIDSAEREAIVKALQQAGKLSSADLQSVVDDAFSDADSAVSLHAHIRMINETLDKAGKQVLLEHMWRVALADGDIDRYEENTIRKLCDLLYIKHREFMQAKLKVLEE